MNRYLIRIVPFDPVKHDLQRYPYIDSVGFTVGYLVYKDKQHIRSAWYKSYSDLYKGLDKFLNNAE